MKVTYAPRDGERREWVVKWPELPSHEAEALEDVTDLPYQAFVSKWLSGSTRARRALLWVLLRREHPALRFEQVRFLMDELGDDFDDDEIANIRARLNEPAPEDPIEAAGLERLREILAERDAADQVAAGEAGVDEGKDTAEPDEPASST